MAPQRQIARGMRTFTIIWFGQLISTLGSGLTGFALGVWIYEQTDSVTLFAVSMLVWTLPAILLAPVAGMLADRWDRRKLMILADSMAGLATLSIGALAFSGSLEVWHIYIAQVFLAAAETFQWPAYSAATSLIVPKEHLGRAAGMTQIGGAISNLVSPAVAGALYLTAGLEAIVLIDFITYLFALSTLLAVRFPQPEPTEEAAAGKGTFFQEALFGWRYLWEYRPLFTLLMIYAVLNFLFGLQNPLLTPMLLELTTVDVLGFITAASGVGLLAGTLVMSTWGGPKRRIHGIFFGGLGSGIAGILTGMFTSIPLLIGARFLLLFSLPIANGCSQAIWQSKVAPDVQGRVFAARRMLSHMIMPISYALAGPLSEYAFEPLMAEGGALANTFVGQIVGVGPGRGLAFVFVVTGLMFALMVISYRLLPHVWRLELEIPDAIPPEVPEEPESVEAAPGTALAGAEAA
jgi:DHA3 family macrolide efflux protein-like MFS transporter